MAAKAKEKKPAGARGTSKVVPEWVEFSAQEVEELVIGFGKKGMNPMQVGQALRDQYGVPSVKALCGKGVITIFAEGGVKLDYPPDLLALIERAMRVRRHLKANKSDVRNRTQLNNIESKIRRLVKYYEKEGKLPKGWRYDPETAALLVK
ncbi:30S ribosomal protein S15 [uncultured archaeon]|nr:30S ribosomal protein S15 [uncultured archaeon]